jgi:hypothetical protein
MGYRNEVMGDAMESGIPAVALIWPKLSWRYSRQLLFAALASVLLGGCAALAPRYDAELDAQATSSYVGVQRLLAGIELGEFTDPSSYAEARPRYAEVIASLAYAEQRAKSLPVTGSVAGRARDDMVGLMRDCREQLLSLARIHQRRGLTPDLPVRTSVNASCDFAARAARALQ